MKERIQKLLANAGLGSRRQIEQQISEGRIKVNGRVAQLGDQADVDDLIFIDDEPVYLRSKQKIEDLVLIYHKPAGEMCTNFDPQGRPLVFENLPRLQRGRWVAVGRLDINTSGLLLFTNNGELANRLMHPKYEVEREYAVRILGEINNEIRQNLLRGVMLEDGFAKCHSIEYQGGENANKWYHVVLKEGRNREVRRIFESQDLVVSRLIRIRYGNICLPPELRQGRFKYLEPEEINSLLSLVKLDSNNS